VLAAEGVTYCAEFRAGATSSSMDFVLVATNTSPAPVSGFVMQFNRSIFGVIPGAALTMSQPLAPGASQTWTVGVASSESHLDAAATSTTVQIGIKHAASRVATFVVGPPPTMYLGFAQSIDKNEYARQWKALGDASCERQLPLPPALQRADEAGFKAALEKHRIVVVFALPNSRDDARRLFGVAKAHNGVSVLFDMTKTTATVKSARVADMLPLIEQTLAAAARVV
jgi:hypothetical protein